MSANPSEAEMLLVPHPADAGISVFRNNPRLSPELCVKIPFEWQPNAAQGAQFQMSSIFIGVGYAFARVSYVALDGALGSIVPLAAASIFLVVGLAIWSEAAADFAKETGAVIEVTEATIVCRVKRFLRPPIVVGGSVQDHVEVHVREMPPPLRIEVNGVDQSEPETFLEIAVGSGKVALGRRRKASELRWVCSEILGFLREIERPANHREQ